jgi:PTS system nitrogen regulatory IIA component
MTRFLNVAESTVTRWIKQRGLPSQRVNGQYRFHRAEVLEWATTNQVKFSLEILDGLESAEEPPPSLAEALSAGGIFYNLQDTSKERALRALVSVLSLPEGIDRELILRLFLAREAAATTAIGNGIALPHVRNPIVLNVDRPMVTLCFLEKPVDFDALDGLPVQVLFSMICPTTRTHLQILSRLSYALQDTAFREVLMRQGQADELLGEVRRIEAALAVSARGVAGTDASGKVAD